MNLFAVLIALGLYSQTFVVTEVVTASETEYIVVLEDYNGNEWECSVEDGDWFPGDLVSAIMDTKGTESIYDDEIVCARYAGTIEGFLFPYDLQAIE